MALIPWRYLIAALALAAALAGIWFHGHHAGAASVQAKWDAQKVADSQAAEAQRESNRLKSQAAATTYEAQRAELARRAAAPSQESSYALHATICPQPGVLGKPLELGDVSVGSAVLDRLRSAGSDFTAASR